MKYHLALKIYSLLLSLFLPLFILGQCIKEKKLSSYLTAWRERFGFVDIDEQTSIWIHLASVGETVAAVPVVERLAQKYSTCIHITSTTPTGYQRVQKSFKSLLNNKQLKQSFIPYDTKAAMRRFMRRTKIKLIILMEAEIWPNMLEAAKKHEIPVMLINGRLSAPSLRRHYMLKHFFSQQLARIDSINVQSNTDYKRYLHLGVNAAKLNITGNIKFDIQPDPTAITSGYLLKTQWDRPVFIAASTHQGEEDIVIEVFKRLLRSIPNTLLILAPRHPHRAISLLALCKQNQLGSVFYAQHHKVDSSIQVILVDEIGKLIKLYAASDVAFVGGSLVAAGGHNILEPASVGTSIVTGEHYFNSRYVTYTFLKQGGAFLARNAHQLYKHVHFLLTNPDKRHLAVNTGKRILHANQGAVEKTVQVIDKYF